MSLKISYVAGINDDVMVLYAIVYRESDGAILLNRNGAWGFVLESTWDVNVLAEAALPLTRQGTFYSAPDALLTAAFLNGTGNYSVSLYSQAGLTPSLDDEPKGSSSMYYDGTVTVESQDLSLAIQQTILTVEPAKIFVSVRPFDSATGLRKA